MSKFESFDINDDFVIFNERLELWFMVNKITDEDSKANHLLSFLSTTAYKLIKIVCAPDALTSKKYAELVALLKIQFVRKTIIYKERKKFYEARQNDGEKVLEFYNRIKALAITCDFGANINSIMLDKFVVGLLPGPIFEKICDDASATTLAKCVELAQSREISLEADSVASCHKIFNKNSVGAKVWNRHKTNSTNDIAKCFACGEPNHKFSTCKYRKFRCNRCRKLGHISKVCDRHNSYNNTKRQFNNFVEEEEEEENDEKYLCDKAENNKIRGNLQNEEDDLQIFNMQQVKNKNNFKDCNNKVFHIFNINSKSIVDAGGLFTTTLNVNNVNIVFEIDTGSAISAIPKNYFKNHFANHKLDRYSNVLKAYDGSIIQTDGCFSTYILYKGKRLIVTFIVIASGCRPLIGRDILRKLNIQLSLNVNVLNVEHCLDDVLKKYKGLFDESLGKFRYCDINLKVKEGVVPIFIKPRPVPFAYREKLEAELDRLEQLGVISRIEHSSWGTPLVTVLKKDGSLRVCADYSVTVNKFIDDVNYPLPRIDDLFQALQGGMKFSKIDLSQAFNQLSVDSETANILAWSTHKGLYKVNRLPFGCKPNSAIFQAKIDSVLLGCKGTVAFIDDIVVTGHNDKEHFDNLMEVFDRLTNAGLKVNKNKCAFFKEKISYLGFNIDCNGLHKDPSKVEAILQMPSPTDKTQAKSFCGLVLYYSRFLPKASTIMKPIFNAITLDKFVWDNNCARAMTEIKQLIVSDLVLAHYDRSLPLILISDASQYGIGVCIAHKLADGREKPIAFSSRTLNKTELNYSMIDKEALAIYFGVSKFQQYLVGRKFTIKTDHRPLTSIFGSKKGIPVMAANRLQRWAVYLSGFDFDIQCIPGKENGCADALSRLCLKKTILLEEDDYTYLKFMSENFEKPVSGSEIAKETILDAMLKTVVKYVENGWPSHCKKENNIHEFFIRKTELTLEQGVLMWGHRVIIPEKFREILLKEMHISHMGMVRTKALARSYFWWPGMDKKIEGLIGSCETCRKNRENPPKVEVRPWPKSKYPFERVHIDYCGPINGDNFLILIDTYSKWLEVVRTKEITSKRTIEMLESIFSRFGVPSTIVSDNAASFTSYNFKRFCDINGIAHVTSPPFHPASNGQAENSVKTFKNSLKKMLQDKENKSISIVKLMGTLLYANRNTIHSETKKSPFEMMFNRKPLLRWDALIPKKNDSSRCHNKSNVKEFSIGDQVYTKNFMSNKWQKAEIVKIIGFNTYIVLLNGKHFKKHANHLSPIIQCNDNKNNKSPVKIIQRNVSSLENILKTKLAMPSQACQPVVEHSSNNNVFVDNAENLTNNNDSLEEDEIAENSNNSVVANDSVVVNSRRSARNIKKPNRLNL